MKLVIVLEDEETGVCYRATKIAQVDFIAFVRIRNLVLDSLFPKLTKLITREKAG